VVVGEIAVSGGTNGPPRTTETEADLRALSARIAALEHQLRLRDDLLSIAAHELRNPMHALLLQVSAALRVARADGAAALVRRLERVQQLIDRYVKRASLLLDVARINATWRQPQLEDLDFAQVVREVVDSYTAEAEFHRCNIVTQVPEHAPGRWDRLGAEQIVSNLVSNAIKFGAGGPIRVELSLEMDGAWLQFQVSDQGIGIAAEDQSRIFGRFEQLPVQGLNPGGAGLGLWLVRELVEVHGGCISLMSAPGRGARFTVRLPVAAAPAGGMGDGG
jgi:two-component system, OmpR family, sensor kinase